MPYGILADTVVALHLGFVFFVALGGLLVAKRPRLSLLHLPAVAWGVVIEVVGGTCPLTPLENWLRDRGGAAGYTGGFVEHYLVPVLYPADLTREAQIALATAALAVNAVVYVRLYLRRSGIGFS